MGMIPRVAPRARGGHLQLGLYEFDSAWGFVSLDFAAAADGQEPGPI